MTFNMQTAKIIHTAGDYAVIKDGRQYTVCTLAGQPVNFLGGGKRGLNEAIRSANFSAEIAAAPGWAA